MYKSIINGVFPATKPLGIVVERWRFCAYFVFLKVLFKWNATNLTFLESPIIIIILDETKS